MEILYENWGLIASVLVVLIVLYFLSTPPKPVGPDLDDEPEKFCPMELHNMRKLEAMCANAKKIDEAITEIKVCDPEELIDIVLTSEEGRAVTKEIKAALATEFFEKYCRNSGKFVFDSWSQKPRKPIRLTGCYCFPYAPSSSDTHDENGHLYTANSVWLDSACERNKGVWILEYNDGLAATWVFRRHGLHIQSGRHPYFQRKINAMANKTGVCVPRPYNPKGVY